MRDLQYFISIYAHIGALQSAHKLVQRHDQAMALWCFQGKRLELVRYWEFERLTGIKGHGISFPSTDACIQFINHLLMQEGLSLDDISVIVGTENILPLKTDVSFSLVDKDISYHSLCHIFSGILLHSDLFHRSNILCLALDAGPDHVLDSDVWQKNHYLACYVDHGTTQFSSISSPAIFWALLREKLGLAEGTLMALGSATQCKVLIDLPSAPQIMSLKDRYSANQWVEHIISIVESFSVSDLHVQFTGLDDRFSFTENKISMIVKIVHEQSISMVESIVQNAIDQYDIIPESTYLSMTGGFALNCPINSHLIKRFSFKGLVAPPVVNDSGMALGMGLHYAYQACPDFSFALEHAYHGKASELTSAILDKCSAFIDSVAEWDEDCVVRDILDGPIVWFDGNAEIGPRALGHRSLLADPRSEDSKNRLNVIKQREWWRPVAPIVDISFINEWFDIIGDSPFMLQAVPVKMEKRSIIPAVCHLDGTARVQTVSEKNCPRLYAVIKAFYNHTGVPMLCNTSLNDKDEPIINTAERALSFALQKNITVAYINGMRVKVRSILKEETVPILRDDLFLDHFESNLNACKEYNPYGLSREELLNYYSDPRLFRYKLTSENDVRALRRIFSINEMYHKGATKRMLWKQ